MRRRSDWPLVGRTEELALLAASRADPGSCGVVISGPAGTGKTRLVREAVRALGASGQEVLEVAGSRSAAEIPLGAFAAVLPAIPEDAGHTFDGLQWARQTLTSTVGCAPGVLVVDDAHLLDSASATLVYQLASQRGRFLWLTMRSPEPAPDALVALWKDGLADRLELQPLSRGESAELLGRVLGGEVAERTIEAWWAASRGNPMFLRELVLDAVGTGILVERDGIWILDGPLVVPSSIHELVRARLRLDSVHRAVLETLAVADQVDLALLTELHPDADLAALERRGLVALDQVGGERLVSLDHPMHGEVVRARLPTIETIAIARRLTEAAEQRQHPRPGDVLRVATWRLIVGGEVDAGLMATAAQQAYHAGDFDLAERLAREAIARGDPPEVRVMLASLLEERGDYEESEQLLAEIVFEDLSPQLVTTAAMVRSNNLFHGSGRGEDALAVLDDAVALLSDPGDLLGCRADKLLQLGRPVDALASLEDASTDHVSPVFELCVRADIEALLGDTRLGLQTINEARSNVTSSSFPTSSRHDFWVDFIESLILLHDGRLDQARGLLEECRARSISEPPWIQNAWTSMAGRVSVEQGRVAIAASMFRQITVPRRHFGRKGLTRTSLARLAIATAQAGDGPKALEIVTEIEAAEPEPYEAGRSYEQAAHGWATAASGDLPTARRHLRAAARTARRQSFVTIEASHLHDMLRLDARAPTVIDRLLTLADISTSAAVAARADHALARRNGDADPIEEAGGGFARLGMKLHAAEVLIEAAAAHRAAGSRRANANHRRADQLLEDCEGAHTPALHRPDPVDPLTPREREVVTLAATGRTSGDIADQLVVSVRTVDNHLHRAYVKLGVHTRNEAAELLGLSRTLNRTSNG